jgi:hypothetical protein
VRSDRVGLGDHVRSVLAAAVVAGLYFVNAGEVTAAGSLDRSLMKLDPVERAHQACVIKGLETVRRSDKRLAKADRIMPDTFKRAVLDGSIVTAAGAAVHANKRWYAMSFECTVSDNQLKAVAFSFKLGDEIPADRWESIGLWQ